MAARLATATADEPPETLPQGLEISAKVTASARCKRRFATQFSGKPEPLNIAKNMRIA